MSTAHNGNVPYYSDGDGSTTFRVPSLKCWVKGANGTVTEVGSYLEAGLPNITGSLTIQKFSDGGNTLLSSSGAINLGVDGSRNWGIGWSSAQNIATQKMDFDASRNSSVYGNSATVQPESIVGMWLVKAYGTVVDTGQIDEQQYIDDRIAALPNTFLPLAGGTMSGAIHFNGANNRIFGLDLTSDTNGTNMDVGWNYADGDGAGLGLRSTDHSTESGAFNLYARNGTSGEKSLIGKPNGSLTWGGKEVERVNASGSNYIRYESGLQICWGYVTSATTSGQTLTFPVAFKDNKYTLINSADGYTIGTGQTNATTTSIKITSSLSGGAVVNYIVVGYWK